MRALRDTLAAWWREPWTGHHWAAAGFAAVAAVTMRDASRLLETVGTHHVYGAGVFTRPGNLIVPAHLQAAAAGWYGAGDRLISSWLATHLLTDLVLFIPAVYVLVATVVRAATGSADIARRHARRLLVIDVVETLVTLVVLVGVKSTAVLGFSVIHGLTWVKWLLIAIVAGVVLHGLTSTTSSPVNVQSAWQGIDRSRRGGWQPPAVTMTSLLIIVGIFALLVAVPADGPLEQLPDVARFLVSGAAWPTWLFALISLALLPVAVAVAGVLATATPTGEQEVTTVTAGPILGGAAVTALAALGATFLIDGRVNGGPAAWFLVPFALWVFGLVITAPEVSETGETPAPATLHERRLAWAGGVAGAVVVIIGVGALRAAVLPLLVGDSRLVSWGVIGTAGLVAAIVGGRYTQQWVVAHEARLAGRGVRTATFVVVWLLAAWLLVFPQQAHRVGTGGVIAVCLAGLALFAALLTWTARTRLRWDVTERLGWARTPWLGLLVVVWLLAGLLDARGAYHDVRFTTARATLTHRTLEDAFASWRGEQCTSADGQPQPLLLVVAPGGGIRAAYWTATALDQLVGPAQSCPGRSVFALSGVSGGSVGVATWLRAGDGQPTSATESVDLLADDRALAAGAAALLTRDLIQPFVGVTSAFGDRAAQIEQSWQSQGTVFHTRDGGARWSRVADGGWEPVVLLNAASVNDGCRVLVTNTGELPATPQVTGTQTAGGDAGPHVAPDCQAAPPSGTAQGPVSAAVDLTWTSTEVDGECHQRDLRVATAALLSARFPYVTPAGALRTCDDPDRATYVVDGGYYENTGMLTLLQVHAELARQIAEYNTGRAPGRQVEPWIVVLDNHYRTDRTAPPPSRPRQLVAPLQAVAAAGDTLSQPAMEQLAAAATTCRNAAPACDDAIEARFVQIAPQQSPAVAAPLGWVLSDASRADLDAQLADQLRQDDVAQRLRRRLRGLRQRAASPS